MMFWARIWEVGEGLISLRRRDSMMVFAVVGVSKKEVGVPR